MNPSMSPRFQAFCCALRIERIWATIFARSCSFPRGVAEIEERVGHAKTTAAEVKCASAIGRIKSAQLEIGTQRRRIICKNDIFFIRYAPPRPLRVNKVRFGPGEAG